MRKSRVVLIALFVLLLAGLGGGVWWYVSVPHTPEAQFDVADKLEKQLRSDLLSKSAAALQPKIDETIEQFLRVGTRFGKNPKAAEALKRIAKIQEEIEKDNKAAIATLEQLGKDYESADDAGFALLEEARMIRQEADAIKREKKDGAEQRYRDALAKLDEYRKKFEKEKDAVAALMESGRIWQDGIEEPLIHAIEIFMQVIKDYPHSEFEPEALCRLGQLYEKMKDFQQALQVYSELIEKYPKSKWAADATLARGKILADQMGEHDKAAHDFDKMAQDFPDDPRAGMAQEEARGEKQKAASEEGQKYGQSRYGGRVPLDTTFDKALPPAELLKQFTAQKLDAQDYNLDVTFDPADHRITVQGTLKLVNHGDDKKDLLLMLGPGLNVSKLTVDGAEAQSTHTHEAWKIALPTLLKKEAGATLDFAYTGQYADASAMKALNPMGIKPNRPTTAPAPATQAEAPATDAAATSPALTLDPQMALGDYGYALSGASWYPITIIGDVFDAHVTFHTPGGVEAVSNGEVVRREKAPAGSAKTGTFEFKTDNPVFGLYVAYGPYTVQDKQVGSIHFYTYMHPDHADKHDAYVDVANRILSFYASKFNGFPYEKMAIIETPLPSFLGGVGPASLMFLQDDMVAHPEVPENLLAHELAHQWFGNLIPINITDPGYNQWLSEGFATYCDALYTEHKDGPEAFKLHITQYQQLYFEFAMQFPKTAGAIKDTTSMASPLYRPIVYEKGAIVLHMLRKVMGDDKFFALLRAYLDQYRNKPSTTDDFRRLATQIYGEDLSWFFSEWYDRSVFAHWTVTANVASDTGGGATTKVTILQPDELVKMPADVTFVSDKDDRFVVKNVMLDKKENILEQKTPFVPVKVIVDEDGWILRRLGKDNTWEASQPPAVK